MPGRRFLTGVASGSAATILLGLGLAGLLVLTGAYDTAASTRHRPWVARLAHTVMKRSVARRAEAWRPKPLTVQETAAAARLYRDHCLTCHGGPGFARAEWASGLNPTAPYLLDAGLRWRPAELHAIIHDGVKMTAMPAWGEVLSEPEVSQLASFVRVLPNLSPAAFRLLITPPAGPARGGRLTGSGGLPPAMPTAPQT